MTPDSILLYLVLGFLAWRVLSALNARRLIPGLLADGAQVVDVRSPVEFAAAHAAGSVNMPLDQISLRAAELDRSRPVIVCCASGTRSAMARHRLRRLGFGRVLNAGSWRNLP